LPGITFEQQERAVVIGSGATVRRIPFSDLSRAVVDLVADRFGQLSIYFVRGDGEQVQLGTLSGPGMIERARDMAGLIEKVTGAPSDMTD
jgi:hypothetical protein